MKYFIYQSENNGCGLACAKMLLGYYHKNKGYLFEKAGKNNKECDFITNKPHILWYDTVIKRKQVDEWKK